MAPCQWLGRRYAIGAWTYCQSCWTRERSLEQVQQVSGREGQCANVSPGDKYRLKAGVFYGSLLKCSCHEVRAASYSYLKWNCLPIQWTCLTTAIFYILQGLIHHTQPFHKGTDQAFPDWQPCKPITSWKSKEHFLPQIPSPLVRLRFGGTSE